MNHEETTFYQQLQASSTLDLRDNRGKVHDLAFVLVGLSLGLFCNRDGCLSSIHRHMTNTHSRLCTFLGIENQKVISRSHLPILLQKVNVEVFALLLYQSYQFELSEAEKAWFSGDGKELRGSIESGNKRGEAVVQLVRHIDGAVLGQTYYNGQKESEKPCMRYLLEQTEAKGQKVTLDALHLSPQTTQLIAQSGGIYLIGLKANQAELLAIMEKNATFLTPVAHQVTLDKGHGRIEKRCYFQYDISKEYVDERWDLSNFQSLYKVERQIFHPKTGAQSSQISFYLSNGKAQQEYDYFQAIRGHWSVEVKNHIRDVTLREDKLKTKKSLLQKFLRDSEHWLSN